MIKIDKNHFKILSSVKKHLGRGTEFKKFLGISPEKWEDLFSNRYVEQRRDQIYLTELGEKTIADVEEWAKTYAEELQKCKTEKERAILEDEMRGDVPLGTKRICQMFKMSERAVDTRAKIFNVAMTMEFSEIWDLLDEKNMSLHHLRSLIEEATLQCEEKTSGAAIPPSMFKNMFWKLFEVDKEGINTKSKPPPAFSSEPDSEPVPSPSRTERNKWKKIEGLMNNILAAELKGVDPIERGGIELDFKVEADNLIRTFRARIRRAKQNGIRLPEGSTFPRKKIIGACKILDVKVPKVGTAPDMEDARRKYRVRAGTYHPDKNPGNAHTTDIFHQVNQAYELLVQYADSLKG